MGSGWRVCVDENVLNYTVDDYLFGLFGFEFIRGTKTSETLSLHALRDYRKGEVS